MNCFCSEMAREEGLDMNRGKFSGTCGHGYEIGMLKLYFLMVENI